MKTKTIALTIIPAVAVTLFTAFSPKLNRTSSPTHEVGEIFQGGIIFQVTTGDDGVQHGLIVSQKNISESAAWGKTNVPTNAISKTDGASNTDMIIKAGGAKTEAAALCKAFNGDGHNDWYLPSIEELKTLYSAREKVNEGIGSNGQKIDGMWHWSSTEEARGAAWGLDVRDGSTNSSNKLRTGVVRAIRKF